MFLQDSRIGYFKDIFKNCIRHETSWLRNHEVINFKNNLRDVRVLKLVSFRLEHWFPSWSESLISPWGSNPRAYEGLDGGLRWYDQNEDLQFVTGETRKFISIQRVNQAHILQPKHIFPWLADLMVGLKKPQRKYIPDISQDYFFNGIMEWLA